MKIPRLVLLKTLNTLKPALATKELVFELTHYFFTGKNILAYNDVIGMEIPFQTDFAGGLPGKLLLGVLEKSLAKEVELIEGDKDSEMLLKAGNARVNLSLLPIERVVWQFPEFDEKNSFKVDKDLAVIIGEMLISIGQNTSMPDQLGITFNPWEFDEKWLDLYSTDGNSLSWARIDLPENYHAKRCTVSEEFCKQFKALCDGSAQLIIEDDCALAQFENGIKLYGRLVDVPSPRNFEDKIDGLIPEPDKLISIPARLKLAIDRATVVLDNLPGATTELSIDRDKVLRLYAKPNSHTELRDAIRLNEDHEEITSYFDPALIKRALDKRSQMCVTKDALILRGPDNYYHLVSAVGV